jgi:hypothetical protein
MLLSATYTGCILKCIADQLGQIQTQYINGNVSSCLECGYTCHLKCLSQVNMGSFDGLLVILAFWCWAYHNYNCAINIKKISANIFSDVFVDILSEF